MASSALRNDQQVKQPPVVRSSDATGSGKTINSSFGTGTGKVINGLSCLCNTSKGKK